MQFVNSQQSGDSPVVLCLNVHTGVHTGDNIINILSFKASYLVIDPVVVIIVPVSLLYNNNTGEQLFSVVLI